MIILTDCCHDPLCELFTVNEEIVCMVIICIFLKHLIGRRDLAVVVVTADILVVGPVIVTTSPAVIEVGVETRGPEVKTGNIDPGAEKGVARNQVS